MFWALWGAFGAQMGREDAGRGKGMVKRLKAWVEVGIPKEKIGPERA